MEIGSCANEDSNNQIPTFVEAADIESPEFKALVNEMADALGILHHPDPLVTLRAVERRTLALKKAKLAAQQQGGGQPQSSAADQQNPQHIIPLESVALGAKSTNSPQLDNAIRILRLLHGEQLRELQTKTNELIANVQKVTANPKCDLSLGRIGR